jgi:hypothetical protein
VGNIRQQWLAVAWFSFSTGRRGDAFRVNPDLTDE